MGFAALNPGYKESIGVLGCEAAGTARVSPFGWPLSVNLSARHLLDPGPIGRLKSLRSTRGTQPDWIRFELTGSALMEDRTGALEAIKGINAPGVELFIDDFGIGYSSLS